MKKNFGDEAFLIKELYYYYYYYYYYYNLRFMDVHIILIIYELLIQNRSNRLDKESEVKVI